MVVLVVLNKMKNMMHQWGVRCSRERIPLACAWGWFPAPAGSKERIQRNQQGQSRELSTHITFQFNTEAWVRPGMISVVGAGPTDTSMA